MRKFGLILLYTALGVLANSSWAQDAASIREGDMRKLAIHSEPIAGTDVTFISEDDTDLSLADYAGQYVVLNFWATWCAPCRKEMPSLQALQTRLEDENAQVVTVATGRNPKPAMQMFFDEIGVDNLPLHTDPRQNFARALGVLGLPVTLIIGPDGTELARLQGDADWGTENAFDVLMALMNNG